MYHTTTQRLHNETDFDFVPISIVPAYRKGYWKQEPLTIEPGTNYLPV